MSNRLRPIRTRERVRRDGDSFRSFSPRCLPHMPFRRRVRVAWMVLRGMDLSQWDIDCGRHDDIRAGSEPSGTVLDALRAAAEAFGEEWDG